MRLWWVRHGPTHEKAMTGWRDVPADLSDTAAIARPELITGFQRSISAAMYWPKASGVVGLATAPSAPTAVIDPASDSGVAGDSKTNDSTPTLSGTGSPGDTITVAKRPQKLRLIHPLDHNYYEVCRTKLGWGSRLGGGD